MSPESAPEQLMHGLPHQTPVYSPHQSPLHPHDCGKDNPPMKEHSEFNRQLNPVSHDFFMTERYKRARRAQKEVIKALKRARNQLEEADKNFRRVKRMKERADEEVKIATGQMTSRVEEFDPPCTKSFSTPNRALTNKTLPASHHSTSSPMILTQPKHKHGALPYAVFVVGAGSEEVNGLYTKEGIWSTDVLLYSKMCQSNKKEKETNGTDPDQESIQKIILCRNGEGMWVLCKTAVSAIQVEQITPASAKYYYSADIGKENNHYDCNPPESDKWTVCDSVDRESKMGHLPVPSFQCWYFR